MIKTVYGLTDLQQPFQDQLSVLQGHSANMAMRQRQTSRTLTPIVSDEGNLRIRIVRREAMGGLSLADLVV